MTLNEKFGKQVLLQELSAGSLGVLYRAARLAPSGLDRIVTVLRYSEAVSTHAEAAARLMEQARSSARLQIPGLIRAVNIGRVGQSYYAAYELVEGRTLRVVIERSRAERFPLAAENTLMVASRVAAVLQALHARPDGAGAPLFHGLIRPSHIVVSWEGEVRLAGTGIWPALRDTGLLGSDEQRWLAPEQAAGGAGDARSDIHALGLVLLEALTGWSPDGSDPVAALSTGRRSSSPGDEESLPVPLEEVLRRALAPDPSARYPTMGEMRRAIDTLLFSGDFTPTTFNLAFFMQTLFQKDMEGEARTLEADRRADYAEFLPPPPPPEAEALDTPKPSVSADTGRGSGPSVPPPPAPAELPPRTVQGPAVSGPSSSGRRPRTGARRPGSLPPSGSGRLFAGESPSAGGRRGLASLVALALTVAGVGGWTYVSLARSRPPATAPPASTLDTAAALARVRELEARLAEMEREKAEIEAAAVAASEAPRGERSSPPAASPRAEPGAAESARRDEVTRRLEETTRLAESRAVDLEAELPEVTAPLPTPEAVPVPPPVLPGELVDADDPEVVHPRLLREGPPVQYPPAARALGRRALVVVEALVSEDGSVLEARAVETSIVGMGFEAAAVRRIKANRYHPATKRGVPVRLAIRVPVRFVP